MSALSEIKTLKQEINRLRKETEEKVEAIFKTTVLELFTEYPNLKRISWTQYTPYFNDGDACTFRSSHDSPAIYFTTPTPGKDVVEDEDYDNWEEEWSTWSYYDYPARGKEKVLKANLTEDDLANLKTGEAVCEFLGNFDRDDMEHLFGDGYKVIITAKGIEVDDFSHD